MFTLMQNTINSGNYKFMDLQQRIARLYAMGNISEAELDELLAMAVEKATPDAERPELLQLILSLFAKVEALTARVKALENGNAAALDAGSEDYPAWEPWDGLSNQYQPGAIVSHKEQLWQSTFQGQNVWELSTVGSQFWTQYDPKT